MSSGIGQIMNVTVGLILVAYVGVEGIKGMVTTNLTGYSATIISLWNVVMPIIGVIAFVYLVVPRGK